MPPSRPRGEDRGNIRAAALQHILGAGEMFKQSTVAADVDIAAINGDRSGSRPLRRYRRLHLLPGLEVSGPWQTVRYQRCLKRDNGSIRPQRGLNRRGNSQIFHAVMTELIS